MQLAVTLGCALEGKGGLWEKMNSGCFEFSAQGALFQSEFEWNWAKSKWGIAESISQLWILIIYSSLYHSAYIG